MILYLDTSSLVKLYLDEVYSEAVHRWAQEAEVLATSRVASPETFAALDRRGREGDFDEASVQRVSAAFQEQWPAFAILDLNETVAGELAITHALRGFDAIHLAAALLDKFPIYAALGVPEVWRYTEQQVHIYHRADDTYTEMTSSAILPGVTPAHLTEFVRTGLELSRLTWIQRVRAWAESLPEEPS